MVEIQSSFLKHRSVDLLKIQVKAIFHHKCSLNTLLRFANWHKEDTFFHIAQDDSVRGFEHIATVVNISLLIQLY